MTVLGQPVVILNSRRVVCEMLEKKSSIYSDRPVLQMGGELVGWKNTLVLLPYGDRFRRYRRLFHSLVGSHATIKRFLPVEELETRRFLRRVLAKPENLQQHIRKYISFLRIKGMIMSLISTIISCNTGRPVPSFFAFHTGMKSKRTTTRLSNWQIRLRNSFRLRRHPAAFWWTLCQPVRSLGLQRIILLTPATVRYVPSWLPGAGFQKKAASWASTLSEMVEQPHNFVKQQIV